MDASRRSSQVQQTSLLYIIGRVDQGIRREMRVQLAEWELSVREYTVLSVLQTRPGLSNAQLARRSLITPQSMIEILAKLERRGLVERQTDPAHKLILRATLTAAGAALLAAADPAIDEIQNELLDGVPSKQREAVMVALLRAMERLSSRLNSGSDVTESAAAGRRRSRSAGSVGPRR